MYIYKCLYLKELLYIQCLFFCHVKEAIAGSKLYFMPDKLILQLEFCLISTGHIFSRHRYMIKNSFWMKKLAGPADF